MTHQPPTTFATRLAAAHGLIARGLGPLPDHLTDQLRAAGAEVRTLHDRIAAVLPSIEPDRNWRQRLDAEPSTDTRAYLLAAVLACRPCPHLRRGGPQPSIAALALRLITCIRCSQTLRRPPLSEADMCDCCGTRGVVKFWPFAVRMGPTIATGDACADCADVLGIRQEAAS